MEKLDLTAIILAYNEELHIGRCIDNVALFAKEIVVIDCYSRDKTKDICSEKGVRFVQHQWPGNQALQFNWALENVPIDSEWILRIDADEYLSHELIDEICQKLPATAESVNGIQLKRKVFFLNRLMKHGPTINLLRIFRTGYGRSEVRVMDEHIILTEGNSELYDNMFYDHSLIDIDDWTTKHLGYAKRNAAEFLNMKYGLRESDSEKLKGQAAFKRKLRGIYLDLPLFVRPMFYFLYRYFIQGSFLDGKEGFLWCFYQAWWNTTMVDTRIWEVKKTCGGDKEIIREYLSKHFNVNL